MGGPAFPGAENNQGVSMKRNGVRVLTSLFAVFMLAMSSLYAGSEGTVSATIPFDFIVANTTLPAGQYTVSRLNNTALIVRSEDAKSTAIVLAMVVQAKSSNGQPKLEFNRYGSKHFLSKVWSGYDNTGRALPKSSQEREIAMNRTSDSVTLTAHAR
jgi:hypothetical protein